MGHLLLALMDNLIPAHWRIEDILNHLQSFANMEKRELKALTFIMGKLGIVRTEHLWDKSDNSWKSFEEKIARTKGITMVQLTLVNDILDSLHAKSMITFGEGADPDI